MWKNAIKMLANSRQFCLKDPMPANFPELSDDDQRQIAEWVSKLKSRIDRSQLATIEEN
jgi:hypothetical protein